MPDGSRPALTGRVLRRAGAIAVAVTMVAAGCGQSISGVSIGEPMWCPVIPRTVTECGVVKRPLVDGAPELGTIDVGYALVRHSGNSPDAAGVIMPNPGGPGIPVISWGTDVAALTADTLADYDVLLIDPRGTGVSTPMDCGIDGFVFATETRTDQRDNVALCAEQLGPRAAGYTSAATADDFDAVRDHLGIEKVIPYGSSYGTYLMTVYAQRHPDRVQSMVLAGAYPLRFDPLQRPNAEAVDLTLRRICERSQACDGDVAVADLRTVTARLRSDPITIGPIQLTEGEFGNLVFEGMTSGVGSDPDEMSPLGQLPAALHSAAQGDDDALSELIAAIGVPDEAPEGEDLYIAVACNDYLPLWGSDADYAQRESQFRKAVAASGELGSFSAEGFAEAQYDGGDICIKWPAAAHHRRPDQVNTEFPDVPVLVLSGDLDAVTPDANGLLASRQFPHSTFVSVPNMGHTPDNDPSGCVADIIGRFVRTGAPGSTACTEDIPPIAVAPVEA